MTTNLGSADYRGELGDGLVARWSTAADAQPFADMMAMVFRDKAEDPPNIRTGLWILDNASGRSPLQTVGDLALVEDTKTGALVAGAALMRQRWEYAGIPFGVGRPEPVGTHPEYRNRGLVRQLFAMMHARSEGRGDLAQAISGIPYFYRQFGYEFALDLSGSQSMPFSGIAKLKDGEVEPYRLRLAEQDELMQIALIHERERSRTHDGRPMLVTAPIDLSYWRWVTGGMNPEARSGWNTFAILDTDDRLVGYTMTSRQRWGDAFSVFGLALEPQIALAAALPSLLRGLMALALEAPTAKADTPAAGRVAFVLGRAHPIYDVLGERLAGRTYQPYAWYVRVPDLPAFIERIKPSLERRLAASAMAAHSGDLTIDMYRGGMRLAFERGRLTAAEPWQRPMYGEEPGMGISALVFLHLLFGHRSVAELRAFYADFEVGDAARPLVEALFPKQTSWTQPLD